MRADLFPSGAGGDQPHRIPSLLPANKGTLLAMFEGRRNGRGGSGGIDTVARRGADRGRLWSDPAVIDDMGPDKPGNPCPVVERNRGAILLLPASRAGQAAEKQIIEQPVVERRRVRVSESGQVGGTWSRPAEITPPMKDPSWT